LGGEAESVYLSATGTPGRVFLSAMGHLARFVCLERLGGLFERNGVPGHTRECEKHQTPFFLFKYF
jgi:hypothetical protein